MQQQISLAQPRPTLMTIACVIWFMAAPLAIGMSLIAVFTYLSGATEDITIDVVSVVTRVALLAVGFVGTMGLWWMRRWGQVLVVAGFIGFIIAAVVSDAFMITSALMWLVPIFAGANYWPELR